MPFRFRKTGPGANSPSVGTQVSLPFEPPFGEPPEDDAFGSGDVALRLAALVSGVRPPYTISVSGEWGIGKTTLMHQMLRALRDGHQGSLAVCIDLWCEDIDDLRRAVAIEVGAVSDIGMRAIADAVDEAERARKRTAKKLDSEIRGTVTRPEVSLNVRQRLGDWKSWAAVLAIWLAFAALFWASGNAPEPWDSLAMAVIPGVLTTVVIMSGVAFGVTTTSRSVAPAVERVGFGRQLRQMVSSIADARPVVLVLDNLDRLSGEDALKALGEIRAFVETPDSRCVFVIPIDRDAFVRNCRSFDMVEDVARDYLEKFFNLDVLITKPVPLDLRMWARQLLVECTGEQPDLTQTAEVIADAANGSPRSVRRIVSGTIARLMLLEEGQRGSVTLPQIAFLEALLTEFPSVVHRVGQAPRLLVEARRRLAATADQRVQNAEVAGLTDGAASDPTKTPSEIDRLRGFILAHRAVDLTVEQIELVLSLREDRDWRGIENPAPLKAALKAGDATGFGAEVAGRGGHAQDAVLRAAAIVRKECRYGWTTAAINGLNAIVPSLETGVSRIPELQSDARDVLAGAGDQIASFSCEAMRFMCGDTPDRDPRLLASTEAAAEVLRSDTRHRVDPSSLVMLLKLLAGVIPRKTLPSVRESLATRAPAELASLYVSGDHIATLLDGPVSTRDFDIVGSWDPGDESQVGEVGPCLGRLLILRTGGVLLPEDHLVGLLNRLVPAIPSTSVTWRDCLESFAELLSDRAPSDALDSFGWALCEWPQSRSDGLRMALGLPLQALTRKKVEAAARAFILGGPHPEIADFVRRAGARLRVLADEAVAERWVSTQDPSLADLGAERGEPAIAILVSRLAAQASGPPDVYVALIGQLANVVAAKGSVASAEALRDQLLDQVPVLEPSLLKACAPIATTLHSVDVGDHRVDVSEIVSAVDARVRRASEAELSPLAIAARAFAESGLDDRGSLPEALASRSTELQYVDWETAQWLASQRSVTPTTFIDALVPAIARRALPTDQVVARLEGLRRPLLANPRVTEAIVVEIAACPADQVEPLLRQIVEWKKPKRPSQAYSDALRQIGEAHPGLLKELGF